MPARWVGVAAVSGHVAFVCIVRGEVIDWVVSDAAARSPEEAAAMTRAWIVKYRPEVVVTEKLETATRKGPKAKTLIAAVAAEAANHEVLDIATDRTRPFKNKYLEAKALCEAYPVLRPSCPKPRRCQDNEPRSCVLFEAVALVEAVREGPPMTLAAAMG